MNECARIRCVYQKYYVITHIKVIIIILTNYYLSLAIYCFYQTVGSVTVIRLMGNGRQIRRTLERSILKRKK